MGSCQAANARKLDRARFVKYIIPKAFFYGFLVWLLTLLVSMALFPIKKSSPVLFDSMMPVVLSLFAIIFLNLYFRSCATGFLKEGVWLGISWLAINILFDLPMFSYGPMRMS